ncbi:MAG: NAD(P)H-dependent oxidoreductase [Proteobacteria bacterium]|nr:NAD(P)H-dependent oxidoreductase [Pseudomonadota bacterium]MBU1140672.1 NAD(P)H-dependent oxidoreductase [Pseudomonadota bacterium]
MNISIILANPHKESFNHAIAATAVEMLHENGHSVCFHDLYREKFDPLLSVEEILKDASLPPEIEKHCEEISTADGIIVVHPNWWGQPPAILKGWIDRVIRPGVAYEFLENDKGEGVPHGLLKAKSAIVFNTSNTETNREINIFGDPLETIWRNCIFDLCGVTDFYRKMFNIVVVSSEKQRKEWLEEVRKTVDDYFPVSTSK